MWREGASKCMRHQWDKPWATFQSKGKCGRFQPLQASVHAPHSAHMHVNSPPHPRSLGDKHKIAILDAATLQPLKELKEPAAQV